MIIKILNWLEEFLLGSLVVALAVMVTVQVVTRRFGIGFFWLEETGRHILIFSTFLGASLAVKYGVHFAMTALQTRGPIAGRHVMGAVTNFACSFFLRSSYITALYTSFTSNDWGSEQQHLAYPVSYPISPSRSFQLVFL